MKNDLQVLDRTNQEEKIKKPKKYNVIFHDDDYTPFDFVEEVLMTVFHKTEEEANSFAMIVHKSGKGIAGTYTRDISETKVAQVTKLVNETEYPLLVTVEPVT